MAKRKLRSPKNPKKLYKRISKRRLNQEITEKSPEQITRFVPREENEVASYNIEQFNKSINHPATNQIRYKNENFQVDASPAATEIMQNYVDAMTRRRDYIYQGLANRLDSGPVVALKDPDSLGMIVGQIQNGVFHPSHFAPTNIKNGVKLAEMSSTSKTPILYTVPRDLSDQLVKTGHTRYSSIPMKFGDQVVMKDIVGNQAFVNSDKTKLIEMANELGVTPQQLKELLKVTKGPVSRENRFFKKNYIINGQGRRIIQNPYLYRPEQSNYPIGSLLKK